MGGLPLLAETVTNETLVTQFTSALNTVKTDVLAFVGAALPPGLLIAGVFISVGLGVKFFKSIAK